jgi:mono/diheme cytochrome c family protein
VEYAYQVDESAVNNIGSPIVDSSPQPYVELQPGAAGYDDAARAAEGRLAILHTGANSAVPLDPREGKSISRYADPGQTDDILDPKVLLDPQCHPIPTAGTGLDDLPLPDHPHWVNTDLTSAPPPWEPRQSSWPTVLVDQKIPPAGGACQPPTSVQDAYADQVNAVSLVQDAHLDDVRDFVTKSVPFGLWQNKPACNFSSAHTVKDFTGPQRRHWMDVTNPPAGAPVYEQPPGAAVFKMICINCHGPKADSSGRLAQNLATMTGGLAAVADFRNGLFGPPGAAMGQRNMDAVYGTLPADAGPQWTGALIDDRAARYMAWMGLGGTTVNIPVALLQIVAVTKVLDHQRVIASGGLSANMLSQAKALCRDLLGPNFIEAHFGGGAFVPGAGHGYLDKSDPKASALIRENYDAELWMRLCTVANPHPVHVLHLGNNGALSLVAATIENANALAIDGPAGGAKGALLPAATYPAGQPVGNANGGTDPTLVPCTADTVDTCNTWPWCVDDTARNATADANQAAWLDANSIPRCPQQVKDASAACLFDLPPKVGTCFGNDAANRWAVRGAVNAGMSVFLYVQSIENSAPLPDYDQCELLK